MNQLIIHNKKELSIKSEFFEFLEIDFILNSQFQNILIWKLFDINHKYLKCIIPNTNFNYYLQNLNSNTIIQELK